MMSRGMAIDRLNISIHGVSALVVEEALAGLEGELRRRLGACRSAWDAAAVPELRVGPLDLPPGSDAAALRGLIAEGLLEALIRPSGRNRAEGD